MPAAAHGQAAPTFDANDVATVFRITKSENRNQVHYGIRLDARCFPEGDAPVVGYWRDLEKGPKVVNPLLGREQPAYGIERQRVVPAAGGKGLAEVSLTLRAMPKRPVTIRIRREPDGRCTARAEMRIASRDSVLERVHAVVGFLVVKSLTLHGRALDTGLPVEETLRSR
jgi:hypothetical protein